MNKLKQTKIVLHMMHVYGSNPKATVVIRCNDSDVICILRHRMKRLPYQVYMDTGQNSDNTRKYTDITLLSKEIKSMDSILPAILYMHSLGVITPVPL